MAPGREFRPAEGGAAVRFVDEKRRQILRKQNGQMGDNWGYLNLSKSSSVMPGVISIRI